MSQEQKFEAAKKWMMKAKGGRVNSVKVLRKLRMLEMIYTAQHQMKGMDKEERRELKEDMFEAAIEEMGVKEEQRSKVMKKMRKMFKKVMEAHKKMHKMDKGGKWARGGKWGKKGRGGMKGRGGKWGRKGRMNKKWGKKGRGGRKGRMNKKWGKKGGRGGKMSRKPKSMFDLIDSDRKGYATIEDWERLCKDIDMDWDNKMSIKEFLTWMLYEERAICKPFEKVIDGMIESY